MTRPILGRPSTFKAGKLTFVSGLHWAALSRTAKGGSSVRPSEALKQEAAEIRKMNGPALELATVRETGAGGLQAGMASKTSDVRSGVYSVAAMFAQVFGPDFLAVVMVDPKAGNGKCVFVACRAGVILPSQDAILVADDAKSRQLELMGQMVGDDIKIVCPDAFSIPGGTEWSMDRVIEKAGGKKLDRELKLSPLSTALMVRDRLPLIVALLIAIGLVYAWGEYSDYKAAKERERRERIAAEEAEALRLANERAAQPIRAIERPWVTQPLPAEFVAGCMKTIQSLPLALDGWQFERANCASGRVEATYARLAYATVDDALTSAALFGFPTPAVSEDGNALTSSFPLAPIRPGGEDALAPRDAIRARFASLMQGVNVGFSLTAVPDPAPPAPANPGGEPPPPPPPPPWVTSTFDVTLPDRVEVLAPALLTMPGVRVTAMTVTRTQSSLTYRLEGALHAAR